MLPVSGTHVTTGQEMCKLKDSICSLDLAGGGELKRAPAGVNPELWNILYRYWFYNIWDDNRG